MVGVSWAMNVILLSFSVSVLQAHWCLCYFHFKGNKINGLKQSTPKSQCSKRHFWD